MSAQPSDTRILPLRHRLLIALIEKRRSVTIFFKPLAVADSHYVSTKRTKP